MNNTNSHYDDKVCEVIEYIVENAVRQAEYDKTIQATIVRTIDQTIGKFSVRYQDSIFEVYGSPDVKYSNGTEVYVLIPGNDTSREKTILGSTKKLGVNYINNPEGENAFEVIGMNTLKNNSEFGLCSYNGEYTQIVYNREDNINDIGLDVIAAETYIRQSSTILCGANIRTALPIEQQIRGNYGIVFELAFVNSLGEINTKNYVLDVNQMQGNPYRFITESRQFGIFGIEGESFQYINKIYFFISNFPNKAIDKPNDIFIKNLELSAVERLSTEALSSYSLSFITPQGTYFDATQTEPKTIQAQVRIKGQAIDKDSQKLAYYWFVENAAINYVNEKYNRYGGPGWECINEYKVIREAVDPEPAVIEWTPASYELIVKKDDIKGKEKKYKCVAVYDEENIISREITISNNTALYELTIESSEGTQFYFDEGSPTLTCKVNGEERTEEYSYVWGYVDNNGIFTDLIPTKENMTIENNKVNNFYIGNIVSFAIVKCSVSYGETYLGTAEITLLNSIEKSEENGPDYSLILHEGTQVFKYNETGLSPASGALDEPQLILPLSFSIYNELGEKATDEEIAANAIIQWIVPIKDTMLTLTGVRDPDIRDEETVTYQNDLILNYLIRDEYDIKKSNNTITLIVQYDGDILTATTNFTFIKDGEPGTNGTEYICKIIPNVAEGESIPVYPIVMNGALNYRTPIGEGNYWFKVQLWHGGEKIFEDFKSSAEKGVEVEWSVLRNKYKSDLYDTSAITITKNAEGNFVYAYNGYKTAGTTVPANIIKCTVKYKDLIYYATMPLITGYTNDTGLSLKLKDYTGFRHVLYTTDGIKPQYDDREPFKIEENSTNQEVLESPVLLGKIYDPEKEVWVDNINLEFDKYIQNEVTKEATVSAETIYSRSWTEGLEDFIISEGMKATYSDQGLLLTKIGDIVDNYNTNTNPFNFSRNELIGKKIYITVETKGDIENTGYPRFSIWNSTSIIPSRVTLESMNGENQAELNDNNWHFLTKLLNYTSADNYYAYAPTIADSTTLGDKVYFRNFKVYNLTELYGVGNEPTKEWCDENLTRKIITKTTAIIVPKDKYSGECVTNAIEYTIKNLENIEIGKIHIPIHLMLNRYGNSAFNDWDGNSISINNDGGFILAPQVGAGKKNNDNSFTGILMGEVKEAGKSKVETGLFGYSAGQRSIFLNAEDGSAIFGTAGDEDGGQIIIKPGSAPVIESNNFIYRKDEENPGTGLQINFSSAPSITFGSGNFEVDADGNLTVVNADITGIIKSTEGQIGGFTIGDSALYNSTYENVILTPTENQNTNGVYLGIDGIGLGTRDNYGTDDDPEYHRKFEVTSSGRLYTIRGRIGDFTLDDGVLYTEDADIWPLDNFDPLDPDTYDEPIGVRGIHLSSKGLSFHGAAIYYPSGDGNVIPPNGLYCGIDATDGTFYAQKARISPYWVYDDDGVRAYALKDGRSYWKVDTNGSMQCGSIGFMSEFPWIFDRNDPDNGIIPWDVTGIMGPFVGHTDNTDTVVLGMVTDGVSIVLETDQAENANIRLTGYNIYLDSESKIYYRNNGSSDWKEFTGGGGGSGTATFG